MPETTVSESEVSPGKERNGFRGIAWTILIGIGIWTILFLTAGLVVPKFSMSLLVSEWSAATLCTLSVFLLYRQLMSIPQNRTALLVGMILTGGLGFLFFYLRSGFETGYRQVFFKSFFHSIFLVLFVFYAGQLLSLLVDRKSYLLPMVIVASVVDIWSKLQGVSKALVEMPELQEVTRSIMVNIPVVVPVTPRGLKVLQFVPIAGGADFLFISFFLAVSCKFGLSIRRSAIAMFIGMMVGITSVVLLHKLYESGYWNFDLKGLPGIPFFASAYLFAHWKEVRPNKREIIQTILFLAILGIILAVVVMGFFSPRHGGVPERSFPGARPHEERPAVPSSGILSEDFQGAEGLEDMKDWSPVEFKNITRYTDDTKSVTTAAIDSIEIRR